MEKDAYVRRAVEAVIKEQGLDRSRVFEADKGRYRVIIEKIQETFVRNGGDIHWANIGLFPAGIGRMVREHPGCAAVVS